MVFQLNHPNERIHTLLMNIYFDEILSNSTNQSREKFQKFLIKSNAYSISIVLDRIDKMDDFQYERALLHGKISEYNQAFRILADDLEDFQYAEDYCRILSENKTSIERQTISYELFRIYVELFDKQPDRIGRALVRLFSLDGLEFNFLEILKSIPTTWSISLIRPIFERAFRTYSKLHRSTRIELSLARSQNQRLNNQLAQIKRSNVLINRYRRCKFCLHQFYETSCVIEHDGSQMHVHCARNQ